MLATKVRPKRMRLANFTALHIMVVSLRCEHSCPYCQVSGRAKIVGLRHDRRTADKALELIFRSPSPAIKIEFQGGEPFLNFELIKFVVEKAELINESRTRSCSS